MFFSLCKLNTFASLVIFSSISWQNFSRLSIWKIPRSPVWSIFSRQGQTLPPPETHKSNEQAQFSPLLMKTVGTLPVCMNGCHHCSWQSREDTPGGWGCGSAGAWVRPSSKVHLPLQGAKVTLRRLNVHDAEMNSPSLFTHCSQREGQVHAPRPLWTSKAGPEALRAGTGLPSPAWPAPTEIRDLFANCQKLWGTHWTFVAPASEGQKHTAHHLTAESLWEVLPNRAPE